METYEALRQFADSWVLLAMTLFFLGVVLRSLTARGDDIRAAAAIPLNETSPRESAAARTAPPATPRPTEAAKEDCCGDCANQSVCKALAEKDFLKGEAA